MTTDYRGLCAELLQAWDDLPWEYDISPLAEIDDTPFERARAALAQPEPVEPTDEELDELFTDIDQSGECLSWRAYARAVLKRWGRPAITPIPLSERLPGAKDCDAEGRCWFWGERLSDSDDEDWGWKLLDRTYGINWSGGPWLPVHALPLPAAVDAPAA